MEVSFFCQQERSVRIAIMIFFIAISFVAGYFAGRNRKDAGAKK